MNLPGWLPTDRSRASEAARGQHALLVARYGPHVGSVMSWFAVFEARGRLPRCKRGHQGLVEQKSDGKVTRMTPRCVWCAMGLA